MNSRGWEMQINESRIFLSDEISQFSLSPIALAFSRFQYSSIKLFISTFMDDSIHWKHSIVSIPSAVFLMVLQEIILIHFISPPIVSLWLCHKFIEIMMATLVHESAPRVSDEVEGFNELTEFRINRINLCWISEWTLWIYNKIILLFFVLFEREWKKCFSSYVKFIIIQSIYLWRRIS